MVICTRGSENPHPSLFLLRLGVGGPDDARKTFHGDPYYDDYSVIIGTVLAVPTGRGYSQYGTKSTTYSTGVLDVLCRAAQCQYGWSHRTSMECI